jgi:HlyD family secretion protein
MEFEKGQGRFKLDAAILALEEAKASDDRIAGEAKKINLLYSQLAAADELLARLKKIQSDPVTTDLINQTEIDKQVLLVEQLKLQIEQAKLEIELSKKSAERAGTLAQNNLLTVQDSLENADKATPLKSLDAAIALAQQALEMSEIKSPIDNATILDIIVREGDSVSTQPVMVLGDISQMVCVAEVNDLFLNSIDLEKSPRLRARISSPALDQPLTGTVISKGVMIGPPSLNDPNPFASVDRHSGTVTIELDNSKLAARFVNLQVEVELEVEPGSLSQ